MIVKSGLISKEVEEYWICERCKITTLDKERRCPCPRGSCEAKCVGKITKTTEALIK